MADIYTDGQYLDENPDWHVADSPWKAAHVLRMLQKHRLAPTDIAEVGCGAGEILKQLHDQLSDTHMFTGYEVSPQAHALAQARAQPRLRFALADLVTADVHHELLLVMDVFEHVPDYLGFLEGLRAKAKRFVFHIPLDLSAQTVLREQSLLRTRQAVGHLHYFTEGTALATLQDTGYRVDDYVFTARSLELGGGGWKRKAAALPRRGLYALSPGWASRVFGGFSILVLATPG